MSEVALDSCLVATSVLYYDFWNNELPPVRFTVERCLLAPTESLLWLPREPLETLRRQIGWSGSDNIYRHGTTYLHDHSDPASAHAAELSARSLTSGRTARSLKRRRAGRKCSCSRQRRCAGTLKAANSASRPCNCLR